MKKIVSLLMVLAIMLTAATAFAFESSVTTGLQVNAVEDENGIVAVNVSANTTKNVQGITLYLKLNGVAPVKAADTSVAVTSTNAADACAVNAEVAAQGYAVSQSKYSAGSYYKVVLGGTSAIACNNQELCTIYFAKTTDTLAANAFAFATNTAGNSKISYGDATQVQTKTAADQKYFGLSITPYVPAVEESPFSATAAGTTITCSGKVDATVANYGVEFTTNAAGTRAQKYYGAMNGDTVALDAAAGTTKTFTFGAWDGTFDIILEGVSVGSKTLNFFANDTIIADTTFTVVVE